MWSAPKTRNTSVATGHSVNGREVGVILSKNESPLLRMTLDALERRDVAEIHRMLEGLVCFVASFALAIGEAAKVDGMLNG